MSTSMVDASIEIRGESLLSALPGKLEAAVRVALIEAAALTRDDLDRAIDHEGSGRIYYSKNGGGELHQASAPGEPIAEDTGGTQNDIKIFTDEIELGIISVGFEGERAVQMEALEFGTMDGKIAPRATMTQVALYTQPAVKQLVLDTIKELMGF